MNTLRTVELYGGPLDGQAHEIVDPFDMRIEPGAIGLPVEGGLAWLIQDCINDIHRLVPPKDQANNKETDK